MDLMEKKVLIVGGGFGGVAAALELSKRGEGRGERVKITLVNPTAHFEYHASLYRVLTGHSPLEVCIPLKEIFSNRQSGLSRFWRRSAPQNDVEVLEDEIDSIDFQKNVAVGKSESKYHYDYLILALGSEVDYYDIPGLKKSSYSLKSISDAIRLNRHLHQSFLECTYSKNKIDKVCNTHIIVVGGGATGVEVAGELAGYTKILAKKHFVDQSLITVDLITADSRLVPNLPSAISTQLETRLRHLNVNIYFNKRVMKEEFETVYLPGIEMKAKTVVWAAGVAGNRKYKEWGLPIGDNGKVKVDEYLHPKLEKNQTVILNDSEGSLANASSSDKLRDSSVPPQNDKSFNNVYIVGDGAATKNSGMAKTAWYDGLYIGDSIANILTGKKPVVYIPSPLWHFLPAGRSWVAVAIGNFKVSGLLGWWIRRMVDFIFFTKILPLGKAIDAFRSDKILWETCPICSKKT